MDRAGSGRGGCRGRRRLRPCLVVAPGTRQVGPDAHTRGSQSSTAKPCGVAMPHAHTHRGESLPNPAPSQASKTRARQLAANPDTVSDPGRGLSAAGTDAHGGAAGPGSLGKPSPAQAPKKTRARQFAANPHTVPDPRSGDGAAGPECIAYEGAACPEPVMRAG